MSPYVKAACAKLQGRTNQESQTATDPQLSSAPPGGSVGNGGGRWNAVRRLEHLCY